MPAMDEVARMTPLPWARMVGSTFVDATCNAVRLASLIRRQSAAEVSTEGPALPMPTLK